MQQQQVERRQNSDRRSGNDRRSWECQLDFPYVDSHGTLVTEDRRRVADRRIEYAEYIDGDRRKQIRQ
jgi:hypothetical protein